MDPNNNSNRVIKKAKRCPNGCVKWISFNTQLYAYLEADTGQKHKCSNWIPKHREIYSITRQSKRSDAKRVTLQKIMEKLDEIERLTAGKQKQQ